MLDKQDGKLLLISKYAIDFKKYNNKFKRTTWEKCDLRKWLNNEFLNTAFSESERSMISVTKCAADKNPKSNVNPGNEIYDRVFLLSIPEVHRYFNSNDERMCVPTEYVLKEDADYVCMGDSTCCDRQRGAIWWLRSPGLSGSKYAAETHPFEDVVFEKEVNIDGCALLALWLIADS